MIALPTLIGMLAVAGLLAGVMAGLLGVGGGIIIVPVLDIAFGAAGVPDGLRMHLAVGTSLASIVPTALASARAHRARGAIDGSIARSWAPAIAVGAALGAMIASAVRGAVLSTVFGTVAVAAAARMMLGSGQITGRTERTPDSPPVSRAWLPVPVLIGIISAMMGIGGGTLSVPVLNGLGLPMHRAVGTSAWFGLWIALPGALGFALLGGNPVGLPPFSIGYVNLLALAVLLPATVLAAPLGAALAHRLGKRQLSVAFGLFLLVTGSRMLYRAWVH